MSVVNIFCAVLSVGICLAGLIGYAVYGYVILKHSHHSFANPFYFLTLSLAIPDCITNVVILTYATPIMLSPTSDNHTGINFDSQNGLNGYMIFSRTAGFLADFCWFVICGHISLIATNRLVAVRWPLRYDRVFSKRRLTAMTAACYVVALTVPALTYSCSCQYEFVDLGWTLTCEQEDGSCTTAVMILDCIVSNGTVVYVVICDVIVLVCVYRNSRKMRFQRQSITGETHVGRRNPRLEFVYNQHKKENALIIQFSAVVVVLIVGVGSFWIVPPLTEKQLLSADVGSLIITTFNTLNSSLNPFLYFIFSTEVREKLTRQKVHSVERQEEQQYPATIAQRVSIDWGRRISVVPLHRKRQSIV